MPAQGQEVQAAGDRFSPDTIRVAVGDTVQWNPGRVAHTVKILDGPLFLLEPDQPPARHAFKEAGTYPYVCAYHLRANMWGVVLVEPTE